MSLINSNMQEKPQFLLDDKEKLGTEQLQNFVRPPRLKVIQAQSDKAFTDLFSPGDVVIVPQMQLIAPLGKQENGKANDAGQPFLFTPLFFFPEWCIWNPLETKGTLPTIAERSFDPTGKIAAMSRDASKREFPCPTAPQYKCRVQEHLNIIMMIGNEPVVATFYRGSYVSASTLLSLIQMREASIFTTVFQAQSTFQENKKGRWYGLTFSNPTKPAPAWINEADFVRNKELFEKFRDAHAAQTLVVDFDADIPSDDEAATKERSTF